MTNKTFRRKAHAAAAPRTMRDHEARPGGVWRSGGLDDARSALALTDLKQALCSARAYHNTIISSDGMRPAYSYLALLRVLSTTELAERDGCPNLQAWVDPSPAVSTSAWTDMGSTRGGMGSFS